MLGLRKPESKTPQEDLLQSNYADSTQNQRKDIATVVQGVIHDSGHPELNLSIDENGVIKLSNTDENATMKMSAVSEITTAVRDALAAYGRRNRIVELYKQVEETGSAYSKTDIDQLSDENPIPDMSMFQERIKTALNTMYNNK